MSARSQSDGQSRSPAFFTIGGASFGFPFGAQVTDYILLVMTRAG